MESLMASDDFYLQLLCHPAAAEPEVGFGRIVVSETEVPNMFVNLV